MTPEVRNYDFRGKKLWLQRKVVEYAVIQMVKLPFKGRLET